MVGKQDVVKMLKRCFDPEIPINVIDLGLIYGIKVNSGKVAIRMTLTSACCPLAGNIKEEIKKKISGIKGVKNVDVKIVFNPTWSPKRMSKEVRQQFGL
jgi:metal-sulfur cluster biosynthetic enzyme